MISQRPEDVFINLLRSVYHNAQHPALRLTTRRPAFLCKRGPSARYLNTLSRSNAHLRPSNAHRALRASCIAVSRDRKQLYATGSANDAKPREIAVLGAGITGLTAAHYLARHAENAHITIYEASDRPGGWIKADRVRVADDMGEKGHVLLQNGPRMLRSGRTSIKYDDLVLYDVLASLDLDREIRHPKAVSDNRYLYYPDRLVKMPSAELSITSLVDSVRSFLTEPIWSGAFTAAYQFLVAYNMALDPTGTSYKEVPEDESVAQFLTRILQDDRVVKNIVSGMMHGIYGGDINKLSAKHTILDRLWYRFKRPVPAGRGQWLDHRELYVLADMLNGPNRLKIIEMAETAVDWKLLAFEDGLLTLVKGLAKDLKSRSNVTFKFNQPVTSLKHENGKILVTTNKAKQSTQYDHAICTLFSKHLAQIAEPRNSLPSLAETHAVTIMVVNLWYPNPNLLTEGGFGYLIPSSTPDNHEGALGVLFDSDLRTDDSEMPGTKLTVMLGGHHWDGWKHFPSEKLGINMAKDVVRRHLGISETEEVVAGAHLCRDCLPQHFVGHRKRMRDAHYELMSTFQGHLTVAGPSYTSVGVMPAMRAGYDAGMRVARGHGPPWFRLPKRGQPGHNDVQPEIDQWLGIPEEPADPIGASGLEQFTEDEWASLRPGRREGLLFREFTQDMSRFRNEDGTFLNVDQRLYKNAPEKDPRRNS